MQNAKLRSFLQIQFKSCVLRTPSCCISNFGLCGLRQHAKLQFALHFLPSCSDYAMINKRALPEFENWRMLFEEQHLGDCDLIRKNKIFRRITMKKLIIRTETSDDYAIVENLTREAFWNVYRPGCVEHYVLHCLRSLPEFIPQLSLVAEAEGLILGHIMYSRASITCDDGSCLPIVIFGPLSVAPEHQRRGIGSALVRHSLALAKSLRRGGHHRKQRLLRPFRLHPFSKQGHLLRRTSPQRAHTIFHGEGADGGVSCWRHRHLCRSAGILCP